MFSLIKAFVLCVVFMSLAGCSKLTKENYDALKLGMSLEEVSAIVGGPTNCSETLGTKSCIWGSEDGKNIKITFLADNASTFSNNGLE